MAFVLEKRPDGRGMGWRSPLTSSGVSGPN